MSKTLVHTIHVMRGTKIESNGGNSCRRMCRPKAEQITNNKNESKLNKFEGTDPNQHSVRDSRNVP